MRVARSAGCTLAYAVTDIGIPSARNLQRYGFVLAYNYVMLQRDPDTTGGDAASCVFKPASGH